MARAPQSQAAHQGPADPQLLALKVPPHSVEAEQSLIGGLLLDNHAFDRIGDLVAEADFYRDDHRRIYRHVTKLIEQGKPADVVTVSESIEASEDKDRTGGPAYLGALAQNTPSALNIRRYAELVRERAVQARAIAAETAMRRYLEKADSLLDSLKARRAEKKGALRAEEGFVSNEGQYWTILFQGAAVHLRDSKGMHYLVELLRVPGRDIHVLDLVGVMAQPCAPNGSPTEHGRIDGAGTGAVLDARAKVEYRSRVAELSADLQDAERAGDVGRAAAIRAELGQVERGLAVALGLDGRDRTVGAHAERARLNVTRAIRTVVRAISASHPVLGRHLAKSITTGRLCRYDPADPIAWTV